MKGIELLKIKELLRFEKPDERFVRIDDYVSGLLSDNGNMTTFELNKKLRRSFGVKISQGKISWRGKEHQLNEEIMAKLKHNNKVEWLQSFHPSSLQEKMILCKIGRDVEEGVISIEPSENKSPEKTVTHIRETMKSSSQSKMLGRMRNEGLAFYRIDGNLYCLDVANHTIINVAD